MGLKLDFSKNDTLSILFTEARNVWARCVLLRLLIERKVCNIIDGNVCVSVNCTVGSFIFFKFCWKGNELANALHAASRQPSEA